jgi:hypothetical protein
MYGVERRISPTMRATTYAGSAIAAVSVIGGGVLTWVRGLGDLALDARWLLALVVTGCTLVGFTLIFRDQAEDWNRARRRRNAIVVAFIVAVGGVLLFDLSTVYHSLLIVDESCRASRPGWSCIGYRPPRDPVNVDLRLSVRDRQQASDVKWSPGFWSRTSGGTWILQNENEHELSVRLNSFRWPERFGVAYIVSGSSDLELEHVLEPNFVRVIREDELATFRYWFLVFGGLLWLLGTGALYFSPAWVSWFIPRPPRATRILEP